MDDVTKLAVLWELERAENMIRCDEGNVYTTTEAVLVLIEAMKQLVR